MMSDHTPPIRSARCTRVLVVSCLMISVGNCAAGAAPPTVKHLFPSGAQGGATAEVKATGTFSNWPAKGWASHPGLQVACGEDKGKLSVAVEPHVPAGVYFIRLFDDEGATK